MKKIIVIGCTEITKILIPHLISDKNKVDEICIASKNKDECDEYKRKYSDSQVRIVTAGIDVTNEEKTLLMMRIFGPTHIINLAPSYLNKVIMEISLKIGANYLDARYLSDETGMVCKLDEQIECSSRFYAKKLTCVTGCAFNPAGFVSLIRLALSQGLVDSIKKVDIYDVGTESSDKEQVVPSYEELIRLGTEAESYEYGEKVYTEALTSKMTKEFPMVGRKTVYAFSNSVVDSVIREIPDIKNIRYMAPVKKESMALARTLSSLRLFSEEPISVRGNEVVPREFLNAILPNTEEVVVKSGLTSRGIFITGKKDAKDKNLMLYICSDNSKTMKKFKVNATTFIDAMTLIAGFELMAEGKWNNYGVFTPSDFEPKLLFDKMKLLGLSYQVNE